MKTKILAFAALAFTLGLSSCGDAAKDTDGEETGKNICVYSYNPSPRMVWHLHIKPACFRIGSLPI